MDHTHAKTIKRELCQELKLIPNTVRIRWGSGSIRNWICAAGTAEMKDQIRRYMNGNYQRYGAENFTVKTIANKYTHARTIKRELCQALNLIPESIRVRWGTGTARSWIDVDFVGTVETEDRIWKYMNDNYQRYGAGNDLRDDGKTRHSNFLIQRFNNRFPD